MSRIYGFNAGEHDKVIAYIEDGKIIYAIEEERMNRIKSGDDKVWDFPHLSYKKILEKTEFRLEDVDYLTSAIPEQVSIHFKSNNPAWNLVKYDHHLCHAASVYYTSGFKHDKVLVITHDGMGDFSYGKVYLAQSGNLKQVSDLPSFVYSSAASLYGHVTVSLGWKINNQIRIDQGLL